VCQMKGLKDDVLGFIGITQPVGPHHQEVCQYSK
jgi:hypothetical protein